MANKNTQIIEVVTKGAKKSEKEVKGVSGGLKNLAKQASIAAGAYLGASGLASALKTSVDLFAKQELAEKKLRFAAGASTNQLIKQAKELQRVTRFGDEAIIGQQAYVKSLGISTKQTKEIIAASVDLAAAMGISLESAVMNTTKTLSGMQGELGEKLPAAFKELTAEQLKAGEGIKFIREQFKGTAEEETKTLTGALDQMKNAFGDLGESVGEKLAPNIIALANAFKNLISLSPSEEAEKEKEEFLALTEVLKDTNIHTSTREGVIKTLKTEYKDYLGDLDLEKATLEDINELQLNQVKVMEDKINQMLVAESLQEITEKIKRAEMELVQEEIFATKDLSKEKAGFNKGMLQTKQTLSKDLIPAMKENINQLIVERDAIQEVNKAFLEKQKLKQDASTDTESTTTENVNVDTTAVGSFVFDFDEDDQDAFENYSQAMFDKMVLDVKARQEQEEALKLQKQFLATYPEQAKLLGMVTKKETTLSKLRKESSYDAALQEINNATSNAKANLINAIMKAVPFPLNLVAAAGASKVVDKMFSKLLKPITAQYGADFVTDGPQMMRVGEGSGPERVQVTPLVDENRDGPQGAGATINISGNVMTDEFVESHLVEKIREATRMGERI